MTNETINHILERRSVRKYLPAQIREEELQAILECGLWAPSASNTQGWHITVIKDKRVIDGINQELKEFTMAGPKDTKRYGVITNPEYHVFFRAPLIMLLSYDSSHTRWGETDVALVAENMCIAAQSLGIGTLQVGMVTPMMQSDFGEHICERLQVPEDYIPQLFVAFGYRDESVRTAKKPRREGTVNYIE